MKKLSIFSVLLFILVSINAQKNISWGFDAGFSHKSFIPFSLYVEVERIYIGLSSGVNVNRGLEGKKSEMDWSNFEEYLVEEGYFYNFPITGDFGYRITKNFILGIGLGTVFKTNYRNYFDDRYLLGDDGYFYKLKMATGKGEYKVFFNYIMRTGGTIDLYIKPQFSTNMGLSCSIGMQL